MADGETSEALRKLLSAPQQPVAEQPSALSRLATGVVDAGRKAINVGKSLVAGGIGGTGSYVTGLSELSKDAGRDVKPGSTPLPDISPALARGGAAISNAAQALMGSRGREAEEAEAGFHPTVDLADPLHTFSLGKNPSLYGAAENIANLTGMAAPVVASGRVAPGSTTAVGALLGGGMASQGEHERISSMPDEQLALLPGFKSRIAAGMSPEQAKADLAESAASSAFRYTAPTGALTAGAEGALLSKVGQAGLARLVGESRAARALAGGVTGGAAGAAYGAAQELGSKAVTGETPDVGRAAGDMALITGPLGALGGAHHVADVSRGTSGPQEQEALAKANPQPEAPAVQPGFKAGQVHPVTGEVEVAPHVLLNPEAGMLSRTLSEAAVRGDMDRQPTVAQPETEAQAKPEKPSPAVLDQVVLERLQQGELTGSDAAKLAKSLGVSLGDMASAKKRVAKFIEAHAEDQTLGVKPTDETPVETRPEVQPEQAAAVATEAQKTEQAELKPTVSAEDAASVKSAPLERVPDSVLGHAKALSDLAESHAFATHGYAGLDAPSERVVLDAVSALGQNLKVRDAIIKAIPVDVMDVLHRQKLTPEMLFHDPAMLSHLSTVDTDKTITGADAASAFVNTAARSATAATPENGGITNAEGRGANGTDQASRHDVTPPSDVVRGEAVANAASPNIVRANEATAANEATPAQHEAGNYKMVHQSLPIGDVTVQVKKGEQRKGVDAQGNAWERTVSADYGHIKRTVGADGEQVDVYLGPKAHDANAQVFVIDQKKKGGDGFDEHKAMVGFPTRLAAAAAYRRNFPKDMNLIGHITPMTTEQFKGWVAGGDLTKPAKEHTHAVATGEKPPSGKREHPAGDQSGKATETGGGDRAAQREPEKKAVEPKAEEQQSGQAPVDAVAGKELKPARAPLSVRMGKNEFPVQSMEDASRKFLELKSKKGDIGGMPIMELLDHNGDVAGHIGHRGEIYKNRGDAEPIYKPPGMVEKGHPIFDHEAAAKRIKQLEDKPRKSFNDRTELRELKRTQQEKAREEVRKEGQDLVAAGAGKTTDEGEPSGRRVPDRGDADAAGGETGGAGRSAAKEEKAATVAEAAKRESGEGAAGNVERRTHPEERKAVDAMTPEERASEISKLRDRNDELERHARTSELTGLRNKTAFEEDAKLGWKHVAAIDMDGLKRANEALGHNGADALLRALGSHLKSLESEGVRFYHRSGDEFQARYRDAESKGVIEQAQHALDNTHVDVEDASGKHFVYEGIGISVGHGDDHATEGKGYEQADQAASTDKAARLASGKRQEPSEHGPPRRLRAKPAEGREAGEGDAERPAVPEAAELPAGQVASKTAAQPNAAAVEKSAKKVADSPVSMKEARETLLSEIDKALKTAPKETTSVKSLGAGKWEIAFNGGNEPVEFRRFTDGTFGPSSMVTKRGGASTLVAAIHAAHSGLRGGVDPHATVTIDVPGDGKFKVLNTQERLTAFRDQVKRQFKPLQKNIQRIADTRHESRALNLTDEQRKAIMAHAEDVSEPAAKPYNELTPPEKRALAAKEQVVADAAMTPEQRASQERANVARMAGRTTNGEKPKTKSGKVALFSKGIEPSGPADKAHTTELRKAITEATKRWGDNAPKLHVVDTPEQFPERIKTDPNYTKAKGAYDPATGEAWIAASNHKDVESALHAVAHEAVGHHGIESILNDHVKGGWDKLIADIAAMRADGTGGKAMQSVLRDVERRYGKEDDVVKAKETLAIMAERGMRNGLMARVYAAVRAFLRKLMPGMKFETADINRLLAKSEEFLRDGEGGERGSFVPAYSRAASTFYSALNEAMTTAKGAPKKGGEALKQWLDGAQRRGEFKGSERQWLGVDQWLESHPDATRQELGDFVRANQVEVKPVKLGEKVQEAPDIAAARERFQNLIDKEEGGANLTEAETSELSRLQDKLNESGPNPYLRSNVDERTGTLKTKFGNHTLPGGENYREHLLTLPAERYWLNGKPVTAEDLSTQHGRDAADRVATHGDSVFRSGHFDEPNILAHVRMNDRSTADGKSALHIEEIQSDWHQRGRKQGYGDQQAALKKFNAIRDSIYSDAADKFVSSGAVNDHSAALEMVRRLGDTVAAKLAGRTDEMDRAAQEVQAKPHTAPDAPLKNTEDWAMLGFKHALREAVETGKDKVTWTTGEQQASRYDLSKQVDTLRVKFDTDKPDSTGHPALKDSGVVFAVKDGVSHDAGTFSDQNKLADIVGKDPAKKLFDKREETRGTTRHGIAQIEGNDLKVGGEGMRGFYDKILPKAVEKYVKQWGGKVGESDIEVKQILGHYDGPTLTADELSAAAARAARENKPASLERELRDAAAAMKGGSDFDSVARQYLSHNGAEFIGGKRAEGHDRVNVHSVDITPAMRESVKQGQPLFSRDQTKTPAFEKWFGKSRITDKAGEPRVLYHGTGEDFNVFAETKLGDATQHATAPLGFHFTDDRVRAAHYAENSSDRPADQRVIPAYLKIDKPYDMTLKEAHAIETPAQAKAFRAKLERQGYDGIRLPEAKSVIAFRPEQIKSASENRGSFDAKNPDIRFSLPADEAEALKKSVADIRRFAQDDRQNARGDIRAAFARSAREVGSAAAALDDMRVSFDTRVAQFKGDYKKLYAGISALERGERIDDPLVNAFWRATRPILKNNLDRANALGADISDVANYLSHIWKNQGQAMAEDVAKVENQPSIGGRRPLAGSKYFTKERVFSTMEEGINAGREPVSANPVDMFIAHNVQMNKLISALTIKKDFEGRGFIKTIEGDRLPTGYARVNDGVFAGKALPELIATDLNNHLDPGLTRFDAWRKFRYAQNLLLSARLGLSMFHAGMTTLDQMATHIQLGAMRVTRGDLSGAMHELWRASVSPVTTIKELFGKGEGSKLMRQWFGEEAADANTAALLHMAMEGGARAHMSAVDYNAALSTYRQAWRQGDVRNIALNAIPAAIESSTHLIARNLVPAQKMTARVMLLKFRLDELADKLGVAKGDYAGAVKAMAPDAMRQLSRQINADVDDRLGQFAYENEFWNKTVKDALHASVQSVGWNFGSLRLLGGSAADILKLKNPEAYRGPLDAAGNIQNAKMSRLTGRLGYLITLNAVVATMGAMTQMALTGQGPQETKDYFYPKTGRKNADDSDERLAFPSYVKDEYALSHEPLQTIQHKLHPSISMLAEIAQNKDFYGTQLFDPEATLPVEAKQFLAYLGKSFFPYSLQGAAKNKKSGDSLAMTALPFIGITPAAGSVSKSPFQAYVSQKYFDSLPQGARSQEKADASGRYSDAVNALRRGEQPDTTDMTPYQIRSMYQRAGIPLPQSSFTRLDIVSQIRAFKMASDDEKEKYHLQQIMTRRASARIAKLPPSQRDDVRRELSAAIGQ